MDERAVTPTGIDLLGEIPWGSHVCLFYETPEDLIGAEAAYLGAGLAAGELCVWALSGQVEPDQVMERLRDTIPDFDHQLEYRQIELVPRFHAELQADGLDAQQITGAWYDKLAEALARGFAGLRASGNPFLLKPNFWDEFRKIEPKLDHALKGRKMVLLCPYPIGSARAIDVLDLARTHQFTIARRDGQWEFLETPELAAAKREISRLRGAVDILSGATPIGARLTPRERAVLAQTVKGASTKESARTLGISPRTVEFHRANIMQKLGARNVAELLNKVFSE